MAGLLPARGSLYVGRSMSNQYPDPFPDTGRRVVTVAEWNNRPDELIEECAY